MTSGQLNARHWIGGEWVDSKERLDSINPATGETIGTYANGGEAEATKAIAIAKQAFLDTDWRENRRLRAKAINEMADRFEARMDDLGRDPCARKRQGRRRSPVRGCNGRSQTAFLRGAGADGIRPRNSDRARPLFDGVPRADGRCRHHCALELADRSLHTLACTGARRRMYRRRQAAGMDGADQCPDVRSLCRGQEPAQGRAQRLLRIARQWRARDRRFTGRSRYQLHGQFAHRSGDVCVGRQESEAVRT